MSSSLGDSQPGVLDVSESVIASVSEIRRVFSTMTPDQMVEVRNPHLESRVSQETKATAKPSSVLLIITDESEPKVLLTRRGAAIRFGGHICLPGGRAEAGETVIETAVRECHEEIGLLPVDAEILGSFGHYFTHAGFRMDAIVGVVAPGITYEPDADEVAAMYWVPLRDMLNPDSYKLKSMFKDRAYFGFDTKDFHVGGPTVSVMIGFVEWLNRQMNPQMKRGGS